MQERGESTMTLSNDRLNELQAKQDKDINYSDIPETDAAFWAKADIVEPVKKKTITIRLDENVLSWLKEQGPRYQTRINEILKAYMKANLK
jgi:uncharacterized protein (DUF4415 family)